MSQKVLIFNLLLLDVVSVASNFTFIIILFYRTLTLSKHWVSVERESVEELGLMLKMIKGLKKALAERTDLKYATDVAPDNYSQLREEFGLRIYANSKKMGAQTSEANINAGYAAARQIVDFFATGNTKFQVNR